MQLINQIRFDVASKVPTLGTYLADAQSLQTSTGNKYLVQIVIYDLPDVSATYVCRPCDSMFTIYLNVERLRCSRLEWRIQHCQ